MDFEFLNWRIGMSLNDDRKLTEDEVKALLGPPPLIRGENEEAFWKWWRAFVAAYEPQTLSDWIGVHELACKHWEQNRLRRSTSALIDGALIGGLKRLLAPVTRPAVFNPTGGNDLGNDPTKIAHEYFAGSNEKKKDARRRVQAWGFSDDHILAEPVRSRADAIILFDRMDNYRSGAKRALQKELDRGLEARRSQSGQSADQNWESCGESTSESNGGSNTETNTETDSETKPEIGLPS
jgi:hypothetical protein